MKFSLGLGFINGMIFASSLLWLFNSGFPPVLPVVMLIFTSFVSGLLLGGEQ
jgi:hypothetical protein